MDTVRYSMGFLFSSPFAATDGQVVLIEKNRPSHLAGKLNAVGGHVEEGEDELEAMVREFHEEAGVLTHPWLWARFGTLVPRPGHEIALFQGVSLDVFNAATTMTEEPIVKKSVRSLLFGSDRAMHNLQPLIAMALTSLDYPDKRFTLTEEG